MPETVTVRRDAWELATSAIHRALQTALNRPTETGLSVLQMQGLLQTMQPEPPEEEESAEGQPTEETGS